MWRLALLALGALTTIGPALARNVTFDGRAFIIDGERTMIISGSVHYPRTSPTEWGQVIEKAKQNGINMIETYIFWDIHEPTEGNFYFPSDGSSSDVVEFLKECQRQDVFVNVRFGPYTCAEWNYGGFPAWLREINGITFRTMNAPFLQRMKAFVDKAVSVIKEANMFTTENGPVIMVQMENEYGNMEHYYGKAGADYVALNAQFAKSLGLDIPWMMCQQGEGVGTAPPADIINTCNGYYCDDWIEGHAAAFPNQPHMWTENWPGWFQTWGQAVPHRPTVDVTFAVARWYAKGGTFMNYYMAFGGSTFGRHAGGPGIITSYDYDVQINEWGLEAEPKFSATRNLHSALMEVAPVVLATDDIPRAVPISNSCESHQYGNGENKELGCVSFLSNYGERGSCEFTFEGSDFTVEVPEWSVSIVKNTCSATTAPVHLLNTRVDAISIPGNKLQAKTVLKFDSAKFKVFHESIPSALENPNAVVSSSYPLEQVGLTIDHTDYLWYSTTIDNIPSGVSTVDLSYKSGAMAGTHMYAFIDGQLVHKSDPQYDSGQDAGVMVVPISVTIPISPGDHRLDVLTVGMGLQNYGPYLEKRKAGIVSNITASYGEGDDVILQDFTHVVGLRGEEMELWNSTPTDASWVDVAYEDCNQPFSWYRVDFESAGAVGPDQVLALDILNGETSASLGKGALWLNGFHLGRYWDVIASSVSSCNTCESETYTGAYNAEFCRTGCGQASQHLYKIPMGLLYSAESGKSNSLVILQEYGGDSCPSEAISISTITMVSHE